MTGMDSDHPKRKSGPWGAAPDESEPQPSMSPAFAPDVYVVSEETKASLTRPALALAAPMVLAFGWLTLTQGSMNGWAVSGPRLAAGEYQTILLHMFAHGGIMHIVFNLMALAVIGPRVMERLGPLSARTFAGFVALFLGTGLAGMATWLAINPASEVPMLGASGAIFGLLGVILRQPDPLGAPIPLFSRAMGEAFWTFGKLHLPLILIFAIPMLLGADFGLAWEAHLGGFVAGLLLGAPVSRWCGDGSEWEFIESNRPQDPRL